MLGAVAAVLCAVVGLSACNSKIGAAAVVGGHTITETTVSHLVNVNSKPFTPSGGSTEIVPKAYVLQTLIQNQIFTAELDKAGIHPTAAQLQTALDTVLNGGTVADLTKQLTGYGFTDSFGAIYSKSQAMLQILSDKATSDAAFNTQATDFFKNYPVNVNPRYGTWVATSLSIGAATPPDFLSTKQ